MSGSERSGPGDPGDRSEALERLEAERAKLVAQLEAERAELRLTNERFRLALQGSPVALFEQDRELRFTWAHNPDPNLALTVDAILGKRDDEFLERPEDAAAILAIKREVLASGVGCRREVRILERGAEHAYELLLEPRRAADGTVTGILGATVEITERKRADAERAELLRKVDEERAELDALIRQLPVAAIVYALPELRVEMVNAAYQAIIPGRDVVGKTLREAFPDVPMESTLQHLAEVGEHGRASHRSEYGVRLVGPDGRVEERYFTSTFQPLRGGDGRVTRVVATATEVTQEVRARKAIAESAERLRLVLDEMPLGVVVRDGATGDVVLSNKASGDILGLDVTRFGAAGPWEALGARHPDGSQLEPEDVAFRRLMQTGEAVRNQLVVFRHARDGHEIVARLSAAPIRGAAGVRLVISIFEDVTQEHQFQSEREQTARFAETFVGILGHDLRNPLNAVALAASLLEHQGRLDAGDLKRVRVIAASTSRMTRMVNQLLDLTRARLAGGIPVDRRPTDLVAVLAGVLDELATANPGITFHNDLPLELTGAWDAGQLAQVASNLLGNAIEHGDTTRAITLTLREPALGERDEAEDTAVLSVHSHGTPIPEALQPTLFDPFRRGSPSPGSKRKGLGLGLYITREIVKAHGGDVSVTSSADEGTTFTVTLPRFGATKR